MPGTTSPGGAAGRIRTDDLLITSQLLSRWATAAYCALQGVRGHLAGLPVFPGRQYTVKGVSPAYAGRGW